MITPRRLALIVALASTSAWAQDFPQRPIRFIVPFSAGGAADLLARTVGQQLTERWKQQIVVDNRAGAGGLIGMQTAAQAPADGYTLLMGSSSTIAIGPALASGRTLDTARNYVPVANVANVPILLVAHPAVPARSIDELVRHAKSRPGLLSYASNGVGTTAHVTAELFRTAAGIEIVHVPYKGGSGAVNDLLGGHVQLQFGAISTSLPHIRAGKLRALGVTNPKRSTALPEVPAIAESLAGFQVVQWFGVFGPSGIPRPVVAKLADGIAEVASSPAVIEQFTRQGVEPMPFATQGAYAAYVRKEIEGWPKRLLSAGIRPDPVP